MNSFKNILVLILLQWVSVLTTAAGVDPSEVENQLKATYLYKFTSYVEWPPGIYDQNNTPFIIGVVGSDEVAAELKKIISGYTVNNHPVEVKILKSNDPQSNIQILFIGKQENGALKRILTTMQSQPVLTISESSAGLDDGSIINFITIDNHIRFEVSVAQAERSGLKISARLLKVAQKIESKRP